MDSEHSFLCSTCGQWHPGLPDFAYRRPDALLKLSAARRARCKERGDACVIAPPRGKPGPRRFYLRGVLYAPLTDLPGESFAWGVWVRVRKVDFRRAIELWNDDASAEPPFAARLANEIAGAWGGMRTRGRAAMLRLGDQDSRPSVAIADRAHPLWQLQRDGLTAHAAFEYVRQHLDT